MCAWVCMWANRAVAKYRKKGDAMLQNDPDTMAQVEKLTNAVNELSRILALLACAGNGYKGPKFCKQNNIDLVNIRGETPGRDVWYVDGVNKGF